MNGGMQRRVLSDYVNERFPRAFTAFVVNYFAEKYLCASIL